MRNIVKILSKLKNKIKEVARSGMDAWNLRSKEEIEREMELQRMASGGW